jgi:hypothetical protein
MSDQTVTVQCNSITSSQDWTVDPHLISISFGPSFLDFASKCVTFMESNDGVVKMFLDGVFSSQLLQTDESTDDPDIASADVVEHNGNKYVPFEPGYILDGVQAVVFADGAIDAHFPFTNTDDHLRCRVGNLNDLQDMVAGRN